MNFTPGRHHFIDAINGTAKSCVREIISLLNDNGIRELRLSPRESGLRTVFFEESTIRHDAMQAADALSMEEVTKVEVDGGRLIITGESHYGVIWEDGDFQGVLPEIIAPYIYCEALDIITSNEFLDGEKY